MKSRKVLVVEDDKMLATVFSMFLKELGHELSGFYPNGELAIARCEEELPDIILMDIHLPGKFDGIKTTEIIQEKYDIPVIYVTGDTDKETVYRALRTKSYGYLVKPLDKTELGINIELACVKHKYDREINIREKRYRNLIDTSPDTIVVIVNGIIEYVNYSGLKLFQTIHIEDLLEKPFLNFVPENYQTGLQQKFDELLSGNIKKIEFSPAKIRSLNKKIYTVGIVGSIIEFKNEKAIQLVISDHTEYLETRKLLTEQNNIIDNMHDGVITLSLSGVITSWNKGAERILDQTEDDIVGTNFASLFPEKDEMELQELFMEATLEKQVNEVVIEYFNKKLKKNLHLQLSISILTNLGNEITGITCYVKDISDRKRENEALRTSEINLKAIFDGSTEAIFFVDSKLKIIAANRLAKSYSQKFFAKEVMTGISVLDVLTFLEKAEFLHLFDNALDGVSHYLERAIFLNERKHFFKITIYPIINDADEEVNRFCISFLDITDRKRTESELAETHAELKPLFDSSIQRFYLADLNYRLVAFNKAAKEIIKKEYKRNLCKGDSLLDFVPDEIGYLQFKEKFDTAKEGKHIVFKVKLTYDTDSYWVEAHLDPIKDETGEAKRVLFWTLDVTEREENLAALRESEERYAVIASGSNDGLWDWDLTTNELYVSPRWKSVMGFDIDADITRHELKERLIHEDDLVKTKEVLQQYLLGETTNYSNEYRVKYRSGEYHWILERGTALRDETGKPYRLAGSITDFTERKKAEEELRTANQMLLEERRMFIKGNVVIFRVDASKFTNVMFVSENVDIMLGYSASEFFAGEVDFSQLIHPDDYEMHERERNIAIKSGKDHVDFSNYRLRRKDGEIIWVKDSTALIRDENGNLSQLLGYAVNITKEKKAEQGLMENQKKYYSLFSQSSDAIIIIDDDTILDCNSMALEIFGYKREDFIGKNLLKLSPPLQSDNEKTENKRLRIIEEIQEDNCKTFHWIYYRKDGSSFDAEVSITLVKFGDSRVQHAIIRDVTERRKTEIALRESEQKNKALLNAIPDLLFVTDTGGNYLDFKASKKTGLAEPDTDVVGKNYIDYFSGDKLVEVRHKTSLTLELDDIQTIEYEMNTRKGVRCFEARITPFKENMVLWLVRDVTDRVEMEKKIRHINSELEQKIEKMQKDSRE